MNPDQDITRLVKIGEAAKSEAYFWTQASHDEPMICKSQPVRQCILAYRVVEIPLFDENNDAQAATMMVEQLLRNKNFVDSLFGYFYRPEKAIPTLELRICPNKQYNRIDCNIVFKLFWPGSEEGFRLADMTSAFLDAFPENYKLEPLSSLEVEALLRLDQKYLVEIRKAGVMLPRAVPSDGNTEADTVAGFNDTRADSLVNYLIPSAGFIEPVPYNFSGFYKLLASSVANAQLRISLSPSSIHPGEKAQARLYHDLLERAYGEVQSPEFQAYRRCLSKYFSKTWIYSLKIQVAADREVVALTLANSFSAQLSFGDTQRSAHMEAFLIKDTDPNRRRDWEGGHYYYDYNYTSQSKYDIDALTRPFLLRMLYLSDEPEATAVFKLPIATAAGLPGLQCVPVMPFYPPSGILDVQKDALLLGQVVSGNRSATGVPFSIQIENLSKHGLIVGATGSGKTQTTLNLVISLAEKGIPFLIIEPVKSEYYNELIGYFEERGMTLNRFNFKQPMYNDNTPHDDFLRFNPLLPLSINSDKTDPDNKTTLMQHIGYIKSCFGAAFPMLGIMPMILESALIKLYEGIVDNPLSLYNPYQVPDYPYDGTGDPTTNKFIADNLNLDRLYKAIDDYLSDESKFNAEDRKDWGNIFRRRIERLTTGQLGLAMCPRLWNTQKVADGSDAEANGEETALPTIPNNLEFLLTQPTIVELEHLTDNDDKALIMAFLLTYLFELRQSETPVRLRRKAMEHFDQKEHIHITIIEEAHRLLSSSSQTSVGGGGENSPVTEDSKTKAISLFIDMLAEIRSKGEGIFVVEQIPTKLVSDVIKNTNLKIMHRITSRDDRQYLGAAMSMNERQQAYVATLQPGQAIVFEEQLDQPIFVNMNTAHERQKAG